MRATREEMADRLLGVFRNDGFDGASLADLSAATGLGRSSLYHHFPGGKEDMAAAVLDRVDAWLAAEVIRPLKGDAAARARLRAMTAALDRFYDGGRERCIIGAFVGGQGKTIFGPRLAATFGRWIDALAALARSEGVSAKAARARAREAVASIQGSVLLAAALDDPKLFKAALSGLADKLLAPEAH